MSYVLDELNQQILNESHLARDAIEGPRIGDYVLFPTGELERFSHDWGSDLQTSPSGSVHLSKSGRGEFSGALNPGTPKDKLVLTDMALPGEFWFFHRNVPAAGARVNCTIPCRLYTTTAQYAGFLGPTFRSSYTEALKKLIENQGGVAQ